MKDMIEWAAKTLKKSIHTTVFTGAGISVESGILPFRGPKGIWSKYDPKVLDIDFFNSHPEESWKAILEIFYETYRNAVPNSAHIVLAEMEKKGLVKAIITQNIDNLHQEAGSNVVYEYHGNYKRLVCKHCGEYYPIGPEHLSNLPPTCPRDGMVLKPDFIFFGEAIPQKVNAAAYQEATIADIFLLIGTTGEVMPANLVPRLAKQNGATIIELNPEPSSYTQDITDIFLQGRAGEILPELWREIDR